MPIADVEIVADGDDVARPTGLVQALADAIGECLGRRAPARGAAADARA